jgi:SAM-dependent methyltransferase
MSERRDRRRTESWPRKLHRLADAIDRRFGASLRAWDPLEKAWTGILDAIVARQSDRVYLRRTVLPALAEARPDRILFVGVRGYTRSYGSMFQGLPTEYWTSDIDPAVAAFGAPNRHVTEDVRDLDSAFPPGFFDLVVLNGVFGWGVDRTDDMDRALDAIAAVLRSGGALLIGWNSDRAPDPDTLTGIAAFQPEGFAGLAQRTAFDDVTHVYAWYRKRC